MRFIFYGEHAILPKVAFENVWKRDSDTIKGAAMPTASLRQAGYKVFAAHPPAFDSVFYATLRLKNG
jgi:hypothetical protein